MKTEIRMPRLSPDMENGVLACWLKNEGDEVKKGEPLFEVETDKVVEQVEAVQDGRLEKLHAEEGDSVPVESVIATLEV